MGFSAVTYLIIFLIMWAIYRRQVRELNELNEERKQRKNQPRKEEQIGGAI
jgi:flagellar biosynthesis/type III secretory pathway M-ring protein FliF/YscJ